MFVVTAKTSASNGACAHAWQTAAEYSKPDKLSGCFVPLIIARACQNGHKQS